MGVQLSGCDKVTSLIAAALIREQGHAYGKGMATGHAGMDVEETTGDGVYGVRQPSQRSDSNSAA